MKVATKFALAFVASGLFSVVVYSSVAASREVNQIESTVAEDLASIGHTLSTSVMAVWERDGESRAKELVAVHDRDEAVDIRWTQLDVPVTEDAAPRGGDEVVASLLKGKQYTWTGIGKDNRRRVFIYVPLLRPSQRPVALELSRPLVKASQVFWAELGDQLLLSTIVVVFATALALFLTSWIISRPLARVAAQARRIGKGDLSTKLPVRGSDEVSALVEEQNAMCDALQEARTLADHEHAKRLAALEQLRHADRLRTVGTLASGIAHELGTPLNVIAMRAKMITTGEIPPSEAADNAKIIYTQTERVTRIVRQLLDFARRRLPKRAEIDIADIAERTTSLLNALAKSSHVEMHVERVEPERKVRLEVDASQIEQALTNLVINGVHAMPKGGQLTITIREDEVARDLTVAPEPCAVIEVADTGIGIAPEHLGHIFEPFFTTKGVGEGTGLGLSVTHGIVEDHGGWMTAWSRLGEGTRFTVYLPNNATEANRNGAIAGGRATRREPMESAPTDTRTSKKIEPS